MKKSFVAGFSNHIEIRVNDKDALEMIIWCLQVEGGIYPLSLHKQRRNIQELLSFLNEKDTKKLKRKFRKIWRSVSKRKKPFSPPLYKGPPTRLDMHHRKMTVLQHYLKKVIKNRVS